MPDEPKRLCIEPNKHTTRRPKTPTKALWTTDKMTDTKVAKQRTDTKACHRVAVTAAAPLTGGIRSVMHVCAENLQREDSCERSQPDKNKDGGQSTAVQAPTPSNNKNNQSICRSLTFHDSCNRHLAATLTGCNFGNIETPQ